MDKNIKIRVKEVIDEQITELLSSEINRYEFIDKMEKIINAVIDGSFKDKDFNGGLFKENQ